MSALCSSHEKATKFCDEVKSFLSSLLSVTGRSLKLKHSRQAESYCCLQIFSRLQSDTLTSSGLNHTPSSQQNRDICLYSPSALHCQMTSSAQNKHVSQYLDSDASFDALNCEVSDLYGTHGWFCCSHFFTGEVNNGPVFQKLQHFTFQSCEMAPYHCIKRR